MVSLHPVVLFIAQSLLLPIVISYGVLLIDQRWHAKNEYKRAIARSVSLGVNSKKHPEKVTLEALFIASEAELEYACGLINKPLVDALCEIDRAIEKQMNPVRKDYFE